VLQAWREVPLFTDRERAALALTEAITLVGETHVPTTSSTRPAVTSTPPS
jgi:alkylhydroperoxidase family enzyme